MFVRNGYLSRKTIKNRVSRNWWLVKHHGGKNSNHGVINCSYTISLPKEYVGKKVRFKVEVVTEEELHPEAHI